MNPDTDSDRYGFVSIKQKNRDRNKKGNRIIFTN